MRIEVDYRLEDVEELFIPEASAANPARHHRKLSGGAIGWLVAILIFTAMYFFQMHLRHEAGIPEPENPPRDLQLDLVTLVLPGALVFIVVCLSQFLFWRGSKWRPRSQRSPVRAQKRLTTLLALTLLLVIGAVVIGEFVPILGMQWYPSRFEITACSWGPWLGSFILFVIFARRMGLWQARRAWLKHPGLARHTTFELDDWGLKMWDDVNRVERHWSTFLRARETQNLLVLVHEENRQYMIPKRAFASQSDLEAARALLQNKLEHTTFLAQPLGFPMTPHIVSEQS